MLYVFEGYLVVNGVKLGEHYSVNKMWIILSRVVGKSRVELDELIHSFIAYQSLA